MKKIKSVAIALILCFVACVFGGCSASIKTYTTEYTSNDNLYTVEVSLPKDVEEDIVNGQKGRSVQQYILALCQQCNLDATVEKYVENNKVTYTVTFLAPTSFFFSTEENGYSVEKNEGFFFHTYTYKMQNPLKRVASSIANGAEKTKLNTADYVGYVIANGQGSLLPIDEYFDLSSVSGEDIALYYMIQRRNLMQANAEGEIYNLNDYYGWSATLKHDGEMVVYSRKTPNAPVWYGLCIIIGVLVAGVITLATIKSKKKDRLCDKTVYEQKRLAYRKTRNAGARIVPIMREKPNIYGYENKKDEAEKPKEETIASEQENISDTIEVGEDEQN